MQTHAYVSRATSQRMHVVCIHTHVTNEHRSLHESCRWMSSDDARGRSTSTATTATRCGSARAARGPTTTRSRRCSTRTASCPRSDFNRSEEWIQVSDSNNKTRSSSGSLFSFLSSYLSSTKKRCHGRADGGGNKTHSRVVVRISHLFPLSNGRANGGGVYLRPPSVRARDGLRHLGRRQAAHAGGDHAALRRHRGDRGGLSGRGWRTRGCGRRASERAARAAGWGSGTAGVADDDYELQNKNPPTPFLWQASASTQKTKRKTRPANLRSARWRACSAYRAEYPRIREFACSRAPPRAPTWPGVSS